MNRERHKERREQWSRGAWRELTKAQTCTEYVGGIEEREKRGEVTFRERIRERDERRE